MLQKYTLKEIPKNVSKKKKEKKRERLIRVEERHVKQPSVWAHLALNLR